MSVQRRRWYDSDFKRNAVQLSGEPGRTVAEVAENLGIAKDLFYRWRREHQAREGLAFPGQGKEALSPQKGRKFENLKKDSKIPKWSEIS